VAWYRTQRLRTAPWRSLRNDDMELALGFEAGRCLSENAGSIPVIPRLAKELGDTGAGTRYAGCAIGSLELILVARLLHSAGSHARGADENVPVKNEIKHCHATALARCGPSACCVFFP
jgi:hypothetical protein